MTGLLPVVSHLLELLKAIWGGWCPFLDPFFLGGGGGELLVFETSSSLGCRFIVSPCARRLGSRRKEGLKKGRGVQKRVPEIQTFFVFWGGGIPGGQGGLHRGGSPQQPNSRILERPLYEPPTGIGWQLLQAMAQGGGGGGVRHKIRESLN